MLLTCPSFPKTLNIATKVRFSWGKGRHSLVTPGCGSQYEDEEEDGAHNGPDDDVGEGDT